MKASQIIELLEFAIPRRKNVLIVGPPGIGKTEVVGQVTQKLNCGFLTSTPGVEDPTVPAGFPWINHEKRIAEFFPFGTMHKAMKAEKLTVWFLDDFGQASPAVQAAYMPLLARTKAINGHILPDHVVFVAATNRVSDRANVNGILEPIKSRFSYIVEMEPDLNDWTKWAFKHNMPTELIAFLRFRPELFYDFNPTKEIKNYPHQNLW